MSLLFVLAKKYKSRRQCDYATLILWVVYAGRLMEAAGSLEELLSRMEPLIAYCNNRNKKEN